ncbi:putative bifunctional diguanylate cyclase/phosphodiesterase [Rhizobium sp. YIM 134829]|uniref:putative bifunctional diguanylate cyclase/phosphodiesterase n=1 Tax=Rhizobium sp. YIM 134829 TaxID=3390453 RepID=UPI0039793161
MGLALDASGMGVWEHNLARNEVIWDAQMHALYRVAVRSGCIPAEVWSQKLHPDDVEKAYADFETAVSLGQPYASQFRILLSNGEVRHLRSRAHHYTNAENEPCLIGAEWDVTDHVVMAEQLQEEQRRAEYAATHDYLTGLPNRRAFDLALAGLQQQPNAPLTALLHLDVDQFKRINDTLGHGVGDDVLRHVARNICATIPPGAMAARIGGDEFIVLVQVSDPAAPGVLASQLIEAINTPIRSHDSVIRTRTSIGIAISRTVHDGQLYTQADVALYRAKQTGRNRYMIFDEETEQAMLDRRALSLELEQALSSGQIHPFYQVQVDAQTHEIVGLEALARWRHPVRGVLSPDRFLPIAEEQGLASELDAAILSSVLDERDRWLSSGRSVPKIAVNLSAMRLQEKEFFQALAKQGRSLKGISFELLETVFLDEPTADEVETLVLLRTLGATIEIDDFGSGRASLLGLLKIRPDMLKLDRHLIADVAVSLEKRKVLSSILDIARALQIQVTAEGIETADQATIMATLGCQVLQGYHFGRPQPAESLFL